MSVPPPLYTAVGRRDRRRGRSGVRLTKPSRDRTRSAGSGQIGARPRAERDVLAGDAARQVLAAVGTPGAAGATTAPGTVPPRAAPSIPATAHPRGAATWLRDRIAATMLADRIATVALPLACAVAWWTIAAYQREPSVAAEARYLGLVAAAVLYTALAAAPRVGIVQTLGAVLLGAVPWALPGTPDRGAAVGVLLAALLAIGVTQSSGGATARTLVAAALGAQLLARSGDLLQPATLDVLAVVLWASVAAAAALVLRERRGTLAAALAVASAFVVGPGFDAMSALAVVAPAAALHAFDRDRSLPVRAAAALAILAPLLWDFERGALLAVCAVAFAGPAWARFTALLAGLAAFFAPSADQAAGLLGPLWLLVLLPAVSSEPSVERLTRGGALALALAAAAQSPDRADLAAPLVVLAATIAGESATWRRLQAVWTGLLAGGVAVLAAYPWLRSDALADTIALFGFGDGPRALVLALAAVVFAALAGTLAAKGARRAQLAPRVLAFLVGVAAVVGHAPATALPIAREPIELDAQSPAWSTRLERPASAGSVLLDSTLANSAAVPIGTVIAAVHLRTADQGGHVLPVRAGLDTGEWAARRGDVASIEGFAAPAAHLHWVDPGGEFFGQRYRSQWRLDPAVVVDAIEVRLAPGAPPDLALTLFHLELSR